MTEMENKATQVAFGAAVGLIRAALADRALTWVAMLAGIAFTGFAIANPEPLRMYCAAGYAGLVFWPVLFTQGRRQNG